MNNSEHLEILRHDTAHVMAMAVQELYPETQVTIGPVIENGFFYDFLEMKLSNYFLIRVKNIKLR